MSSLSSYPSSVYLKTTVYVVIKVYRSPLLSVSLLYKKFVTCPLRTTVCLLSKDGSILPPLTFLYRRLKVLSLVKETKAFVTRFRVFLLVLFVDLSLFVRVVRFNKRYMFNVCSTLSLFELIKVLRIRSGNNLKESKLETPRPSRITVVKWY